LATLVEQAADATLNAMRNDLRAACVHCARRLPARFKVCPRCRRATQPPDQALAELARDRGLSARVGRPLRDAFLCFPAILGIVFCFCAAIGLAVSASMTFDDNGASRIIGGVVGLFAGLGGAVAAGALVWVAWASLVMLVSWLFGGTPDRRLHPAPFPSPQAAAAPPEPWAPAVVSWAKRHKGGAALLLLALFAVEVGAWLLTAGRREPDPGASGFLEGLVAGGAVQLLVIALSAVPLLLGAQAALWVLDRSRLAKHLLETRVAEKAQAARGGGLAALQASRAVISGVASAEEGNLVVAPLSGERCLAFRLVGRVGAALIDDAESAPLAVAAEGERVPIRATSLLLDLPLPDVASPELDGAAQARLRAFLAARGLPAVPALPKSQRGPRRSEPDAPPLVIELGETLLREGDAITAHGAITRERAVGAGYRGTRQARVLGDGDQLPVLISA
jgi:hypothetical protein